MTLLIVLRLWTVPWIKNWFGYDEDGNVILNENLVRQYVADLGLKYDTMGQTRTFLTYDNRQVEN